MTEAPGIILAPSPVKRKRGPRTTARRKEADEQAQQKASKSQSR